jgi:hypothetical protein
VCATASSSAIATPTGGLTTLVDAAIEREHLLHAREAEIAVLGLRAAITLQSIERIKSFL